VVELAGDGRVTRCIEKPAVPPSLTVVLCVYYFPAPLRARIQDFIREGGNGDAPGYLIEWLVSREPVHGFMTGGEWFDIGTQETYQLAVQRWQGERRHS
jgi:NDP-sugar pyrophosphorylase family protein